MEERHKMQSKLKNTKNGIKEDIFNYINYS